LKAVRECGPFVLISNALYRCWSSCFLQGPGDELAEYDVLMEIDTETLTEDAYKVDEFAGKVTLLVEAQVGF